MMNYAVRWVLLPSCRTLLASLFVATLVACESEEATQMKQIAGTYAMTSHDAMAARLLEGSTMTLQADGKWRTSLRLDPSLSVTPVQDSGTWIYRPDGPTLAFRSSEGNVTNLVVRGDTLSPVIDERQRALAEAVTNIKMTENVGSFYVRVP
jgi:hypothetical protein